MCGFALQQFFAINSPFAGIPFTPLRKIIEWSLSKKEKRF
jgi:hypothetical protein